MYNLGVYTAGERVRSTGTKILRTGSEVEARLSAVSSYTHVSVLFGCTRVPAWETQTQSEPVPASTWLVACCMPFIIVQYLHTGRVKSLLLVVVVHACDVRGSIWLTATVCSVCIQL